MTFSSDEVNFLVYRYLEESGFHHSAYLFGTESNVFNAGIDSTLVPKGALLSIIQKGIFYAEAELFSIISDADLDVKLERSVGSMTLIESIMPDGVRQKSLQIITPSQCTPRAGTSTTTNVDRSSVQPVRTPLSVPMTSDGLQACSTTTLSAGSTPLLDKQIKREREIRAQQTVNNLIVSSNSPNSGSSVPRGSYRHDLKSTTPAPSIATTSTAAFISSLPTASVTPTPTGLVTSSGFVHLDRQGVPSSITSQLTNHLPHSVSASMIGVAAPTSNGILSNLSSSSGSSLMQLERERESREASVNRILPNGHHFAGTQPNSRLKMQIAGTNINIGGGGGTTGGGTMVVQGTQAAANTAGSLTTGSVPNYFRSVS